MIENWNRVVEIGDTVYHLGDFAFKSNRGLERILDRLNGNIFLIKGNHEKAVMGKASIRGKFGWVKDYYELKVPDEDDSQGKQKICLFHYSQRSWNGAFRGSWHLFGHSHGKLDNEPWGLSFDVGVDSHDFTPVSYEEVKEIMKNKIPNPR